MSESRKIFHVVVKYADWHSQPSNFFHLEFNGFGIDDIDAGDSAYPFFGNGGVEGVCIFHHYSLNRNAAKRLMAISRAFPSLGATDNFVESEGEEHIYVRKVCDSCRIRYEEFPNEAEYYKVVEERLAEKQRLVLEDLDRSTNMRPKALSTSGSWNRKEGGVCKQTNR